MVVCKNKRDAHLALNQITNYRNRLDNEKDGLLVQALNRLMNVFQSRLFLGLLDIQEFYEAVLLDPQKTKEEKTSAALEIASRWENISSPSLVASTTDLRIPHSLLKKTDCFDRARSMYHINLDNSQKSYSLQPTQISPYHDLHVVNLDKSWKHMEADLKYEYQSSNSLHNVNQSPSLKNTSDNRLKRNADTEFITENPLFVDDQSNKKLYDIKLSPDIPVAKPRQKRLKRPKSTLTHEFDARLSRKLDESTCSNDLLSIHDDIPPNSLENNELIDRQWALLSRLPVTMEVIIEKSSKGFGFSIAGGHDNTLGPDDNDTDIYVTRVNPGGPADHESGLHALDDYLSMQ